jgi:hypothetical protein
MYNYTLYDKLSNPFVKHVRGIRFGSIRRETCMILLDNPPHPSSCQLFQALDQLFEALGNCFRKLATVAGTRQIIACYRPLVACTQPTVACTWQIVTYVTNLFHQLSVDVCDNSLYCPLQSIAKTKGRCIASPYKDHKTMCVNTASLA